MNAVASVEPSYLIVSSPLSGFVIVNESVALSKSRVSDASVTVAACLSLAAKECDRITVPSQSTNSTVWVAPVTRPVNSREYVDPVRELSMVVPSYFTVTGLLSGLVIAKDSVALL